MHKAGVFHETIQGKYWEGGVIECQIEVSFLLALIHYVCTKFKITKLENRMDK